MGGEGGVERVVGGSGIGGEGSEEGRSISFVVWTRKKKAEASVSVNCSKYPLSFPVSSLVVFSLSEFRLVHLDYHSGTTNRRRVGDEVVGDSSVEDGLPVADGILRDPD